MVRPDLTARATSLLQRLQAGLQEPGRRTTTVGGAIVGALALHGLTGVTGMAWLSAAGVLAAGLGGGWALGLPVALGAGLAHLVLDGLVNPDVAHMVGAVVRLAAFVGVALLGAVFAHLDRQRAEAQLRSATQDSTTGLLNVRAFYEALEELHEHGVGYSILLADIVGMGALNEEYGHPTGTEAIRTLGHILRRDVERDDLVARLGSDDIAIALIGADAAGALAAARRLSARLAEESITLPDDQRFQVRARFGVATFPDDGGDAASLLRQADHALQDAKEHGPEDIGTQTADRS